MKQIIKGAFTKFQTACEKCGCEFEYEFQDIFQDNFLDVKDRGLTVICPDCGFYTYHDAEDGKPSSRKPVADLEPKTKGEGWCAGCYGRYPKLFLFNHPDGNGYWVCEDCYKKGRVN